MKTMTKTKHYGSRISQRGIRETNVALALRYGIRYGDKVVLGRKQTRYVIQALDRQRKDLIRVMDKGGVVVIEQDGNLITAYDFDSFNRY